MTPPSPDAVNQTIQAIKAAGPLPTQQSGFGWGSIGTWATVISVVTGFLSVFFVFLPKWKDITNKRLDTLDEERRKDMADMRIELRDIKAQLAAAVKIASEADTRSAVLRAVVSMLTAEISRNDPLNPVLLQAKAMIADATSGDLGLGRGLADIARKVAEL